MAASWPTAVATDANLYLAVNELQTNLSSGINSAVTTLTINSTTSFPTVGLVLIDNEIIKYTGVSGSTLTGCTRGFDGTTAASHSAAAVVSFAICAAHHNSLKDEIEAIEATLRDLVGLSPTLPLTVSLPVKTDSNGHLTAAQLSNSDIAAAAGVALSKLAALGTSKALQSNASTGFIEVSSVTNTELGYLSGVTSAIQTQLNAKIANPLTGSLAGGGNNITNLGNLSFDTPGTKGIVGCDGTGAATAGNVGEIISATATGTASTSPYNATSITLTAGDWDVYFFLNYNGATGNTYIHGGISVNSASFTGTTEGLDAGWAGTSSADGVGGFTCMRRMRVSTSTVVYGVGQFSAAKAFQTGISARRIR